MKHTVAELEGELLDAAVAMANGYVLHFGSGQGRSIWAYDGDKFVGYIAGNNVPAFKPSTDWALGGPIMDRERIANGPSVEGTGDPDELHYAMRIAGNGQRDGAYFFGPTRLVAGMRARVASKFGDEIDLP